MYLPLFIRGTANRRTNCSWIRLANRRTVPKLSAYTLFRNVYMIVGSLAKLVITVEWKEVLPKDLLLGRAYLKSVLSYRSYEHVEYGTEWFVLHLCVQIL